jgi:hypothetical protein
MHAAFRGKVEIPGQQFQITHDEIAFEDETFLEALIMNVRLISCTGQGAHQHRAPFGDGIIEKNLISHARRHLAPNAGARAPRERAWNTSCFGVDRGKDPGKNALRRMLRHGRQIQGGEIFLPKLDFVLQGLGLQVLRAGKPRSIAARAARRAMPST